MAKKGKMKMCKHCGNEIASKAKVCPHCGGKNKKPLFKRVSFWLLVIVLVLIVALISGSGNQYELSDDANNLSKAEYAKLCKTIDYDDLARDAAGYEGEKFEFTGEVQQVVYDSESGESEYMISVTKEDYDFYTDNVYVYYTRGENDKLIEDDIVTFYGEASGEKSYTSVLGESITIPAVTAVYVDIH